MGFINSVSDFTNLNVIKNYKLSKLTSYKTGGNTKYFCKVDNVKDLRTVIELSKVYKIPYFIIGNGSNILASDNGYEGLIITLKDLKGIKENSGVFSVTAGENLSELILELNKKGINSLNPLIGIPGTVGGAICMNAGCFGENISDYIMCVETLSNGKLKIYDKNECRFEYRNSRFLNKKDIIISVKFKFDKNVDFKPIDYYISLRKARQPKGKTCGSVFRNVCNVSVGELIEKAGLKDYRIGGAVVSKIHANFIVNDKNATSNDIYLLIKKIKQVIKEKYNIDLTEEVIYLGKF